MKKPIAALLDSVEPTVIDEELIRKCVPQAASTQGAGGLSDGRGADDKHAGKDGVELTEVDALAFSFKNIQKIDNLAGLEQLVKLQLDNNIISKIENLDHLVNLTWLGTLHRITALLVVLSAQTAQFHVISNSIIICMQIFRLIISQSLRVYPI